VQEDPDLKGDPSGQAACHFPLTGADT